MEPKEIDIEFPRGDTCSICFSLIDAGDDVITFKPGSEIYFTVKQNYNTKYYILQKRYSRGEIRFNMKDYNWSLVLASKDTARLNYGTYVYDICVKSGDLVKTVVRGNITLTNESTFIDNE